jgi:hypothetical protein
LIDPMPMVIEVDLRTTRESGRVLRELGSTADDGVQDHAEVQAAIDRNWARRRRDP